MPRSVLSLLVLRKRRKGGKGPRFRVLLASRGTATLLQRASFDALFPLRRGAVPPGARFDPFGPPHPNNPGNRHTFAGYVRRERVG